MAQRLCAWRTFGIVLQRLLHDCNACSRHASRAAAPRVAASGILRSWGWVSTGSKISPVVGACVAGEFPPGPCALSPGSLKSCLRCAHTLRHQIARATSAAFRLFAFAKGFGADATSLASAKCCKCAVYNMYSRNTGGESDVMHGHWQIRCCWPFVVNCWRHVRAWSRQGGASARACRCSASWPVPLAVAPWQWHAVAVVQA